MGAGGTAAAAADGIAAAAADTSFTGHYGQAVEPAPATERYDGTTAAAADAAVSGYYGQSWRWRQGRWPSIPEPGEEVREKPDWPFEDPRWYTVCWVCFAPDHQKE